MKADEGAWKINSHSKTRACKQHCTKIAEISLVFIGFIFSQTNLVFKFNPVDIGTMDNFHRIFFLMRLNILFSWGFKPQNVLIILFHVSSQASSRLYWRKHAHVVSQLSTRYETTSIKQESSEEKSSISPGKKDKHFIFFLLIITEDSLIISLDLSNNFPEAEESETRDKEPAPKNIQGEDRQSIN